MPRWTRSLAARLRADRGAATAETAIVMPVIALLVAVLLIAGLGVSAQVRLEHAARSAARELARGEDPAAASAVAERVGGEGTVVQISADGDWVLVTTARTLQAPGGVLAGASWEISADAAARREPHLVGSS